MWGLIGPIFIDEFFVKPAVPAIAFGFLPSLTTFLVTPCIVFFVTRVYWK